MVRTSTKFEWPVINSRGTTFAIFLIAAVCGAADNILRVRNWHRSITPGVTGVSRGNRALAAGIPERHILSLGEMGTWA